MQHRRPLSPTVGCDAEAAAGLRQCQHDVSPNARTAGLQRPGQSNQQQRGLRDKPMLWLLAGPFCLFVFMALYLYAAAPNLAEKPEEEVNKQASGPRGAAMVRLRGSIDAAPRAASEPLLVHTSPRLADDAHARVRGAAPGLQAQYQRLREAGRFQCLDGARSFSSFDVVNDEFCDCEDGSDEPGTSACAGLDQKASSGGFVPAPMFHCAWQLEGAAERAGAKAAAPTHGRFAVLRAGAVNDGICDCCGGQDEWNEAVGATTCSDRCAEEEKAQQAQASKAKAGSQKRAEYAKRAKTLMSEKRFQGVDGGPDGVFLAAAAEGCLKLDDGDYVYELCLFDKVTQRAKHQSKTFKLGQGHGKWKEVLWEHGEARKDYEQLIMGGGEYCHASSAPRRAEINFECSDRPALVSIQETQVCVYSVRMQTPAACVARDAD
eukprot:TRINITY_DN24369_c0_g1_i2.p1 TRINITY_DN24369_c0_g1~~TRINITY_DN24369_c0_g1_i2.p1  ORF type:complete len:434 (-),score=103.91 TRINITY_DN24369_c0_g1_i2:45-1346(-)